MDQLVKYINKKKLKETYGIFLIELNHGHLKTLFNEFITNINQNENERKQEELFERYMIKMKEKQLKESQKKYELRFLMN